MYKMLAYVTVTFFITVSVTRASTLTPTPKSKAPVNNFKTDDLTFQEIALGTPMAEMVDKVLKNNPTAVKRGSYYIQIPNYSLSIISMDVVLGFSTQSDDHKFTMFRFEKTFEDDLSELKRHADVLSDIFTRKYGKPNYHNPIFRLMLATYDGLTNTDTIYSNWNTGDRRITIYITKRANTFVLSGVITTSGFKHLMLSEYSHAIESLEKSKQEPKEIEKKPLRENKDDIIEKGAKSF